MFEYLGDAVWGLVRVVRNNTEELRKHRIATNANTDALGAVAASNDRLAQAIEKLAEPGVGVPTTAEWNDGTIVPE